MEGEAAERFEGTLRALCAEGGLYLPEETLARLFRYYEMLEEANRSFNLTRVEGPSESARRHFYDSFAAPALTALADGSAVVDVGTGAGFPGLPIAILRPRLSVTLLDSMRKRTDFLHAVVAELGLKNVEVVHGRAEDFGRWAGRERFDAALSRALAGLPALLEYTLPLVRVGGVALAWRGPAAPDELKEASRAARLLGGDEGRALPYRPGGEEQFYIVMHKKIRPVPLLYPRKAGTPTKSPLI